MIDRLTLHNYKAFRHAEIPLGPLTLLTGLNSSGKSSVLQSLALLRQSHEAGDLEAGSFMSAAQEAGLRTSVGNQGFLLNGELVSLGTGEDVLHEDFTEDEPRIGLAVDEGPYHYGWTAEYEGEQNLLPLLDVELPRDAEGAATPTGPEAVTPAFLTAPFQYLHADRISPAEFYPRDHHAAIGRGFLGVRGAGSCAGSPTPTARAASSTGTATSCRRPAGCTSGCSTRSAPCASRTSGGNSASSDPPRIPPACPG
ncbi:MULTISPECIES: AAA family ATPase [unclassified Streptomyces]|uniref:AAA family ATPase n=1 Tax=unclassified Streptomyces TaxID=2593676 RepID=UPI001F540AA2|nr:MULTISPECIES: AAA family ATPase [unclassified Streptomyces]